MRIAPLGASLVIACSGRATVEAPVAIDPAAVPEQVVGALGDRITREVDCLASDVRFVCDLLGVPGDPFEPPAAARSWVGLHFALRPSRTIEDGTRETLYAARLTMRSDGAWVERLDQAGTQASLELPRIRNESARAAMGLRDDVPVPLTLASELDTLPATPITPLRRDDDGWVLEGARTARIWHVAARDGRPAAYVVVEPVDRGDAGAFVAVFPDLSWQVPTAPEGDTDAGASP